MLLLLLLLLLLFVLRSDDIRRVFFHNYNNNNTKYYLFNRKTSCRSRLIMRASLDLTSNIAIKNHIIYFITLCTHLIVIMSLSICSATRFPWWVGKQLVFRSIRPKRNGDGDLCGGQPLHYFIRQSVVMELITWMKELMINQEKFIIS